VNSREIGEVTWSYCL